MFDRRITTQARQTIDLARDERHTQMPATAPSGHHRGNALPLAEDIRQVVKHVVERLKVDVCECSQFDAPGLRLNLAQKTHTQEVKDIDPRVEVLRAPC